VALVTELFAAALAGAGSGAGEQTVPDLGLGALLDRADQVLAALGQPPAKD
jgi:hypothetical protein